jgi:hypothetical protein
MLRNGPHDHREALTALNSGLPSFNNRRAWRIGAIPGGAQVSRQRATQPCVLTGSPAFGNCLLRGLDLDDSMFKHDEGASRAKRAQTGNTDDGVASQPRGSRGRRADSQLA